MQELVLSGILERSQGRGTFVHQRFSERRKIAAALRVGLVFHPEASLADFYHGQIFDGVHKAADCVGSDLILLRFGEDIRNECNGYLFVNPFPEDMEKLRTDLPRGLPGLIVGAHGSSCTVPCIDVDNKQIARQAVQHLAQLGIGALGTVGAAYKISNSRDRWQGFSEICRELGISCHESHAVKGAGWQLDEHDLTRLADMLGRPDRPTAIFAAGYSFSLDVYATATAVGLSLPEDLSIVGVDDPPGAAHLSPPMTTIRQPLAELGQEAIRVLAGHIQHGTPLESRLFSSELVVRRSSGAYIAHAPRRSAG